MCIFLVHVRCIQTFYQWRSLIRKSMRRTSKPWRSKPFGAMMCLNGCAGWVGFHSATLARFFFEMFEKREC